MRVGVLWREGDEERSCEAVEMLVVGPERCCCTEGSAAAKGETREVDERAAAGRTNTLRSACARAMSVSYRLAVTMKRGSGTKPERSGSSRCCTTCTPTQQCRVVGRVRTIERERESRKRTYLRRPRLNHESGLHLAYVEEARFVLDLC
jgi:hypothetical protein